MRIGCVVTHFSPLSESFIRREALALCDLGHCVFVYANCFYYEAQASVPVHPNLIIRETPFLNDPDSLTRAARADGIDHLHGCLMTAAHRASYVAARALQTPFTFRIYSGIDVFTKLDPDLYSAAASDDLCVKMIVEDDFMMNWIRREFGVPGEKIAVVPNSFDLERYRLPAPRTSADSLAILAIARFVPKKGLQHLVDAFQELSTRRQDVELWLVGYGPQETQLRQLAGNNQRIKFHGAVSEDETRRFYAAADIFCLPCVQTESGDADGIPTTILEAMAFELPVVCTDLLSMSCYVTDGCEGLLVPPGSARALAAALDRLVVDPTLRSVMGRAARERVSRLCEIKVNATRIEQIFVQGRRNDWHLKLRELERQRASYSPERQSYYHDCRLRAVDYFQMSSGRLLDIGCWLGELKKYLPPAVDYYGCDTAAHEEVRSVFPFVAAQGENLPFPDNYFDAAVFYAVLIHVFDVDRALAEAARVLKPGGRLYLQECYDDPNPIHMNHFSAESLRQRIAEHFEVVSSAAANEYLMMMIAEKPAEPEPPTIRLQPSVTNREHASDRTLPARRETDRPLVSICITTYNRAHLISRSIESVLAQTYPNVEVVVVDDGSTDNTCEVLETFGSSIRVAFNPDNRGMAFSKNRGLMMTSSSAKYVGILDSDDYYDLHFAERCVDFLESHPEAGLVYTDDIMIDAAGRELWRQPAVEPWSMDAWLRTCNLRGDTWLARRDLVMQTRLHDEATEHDHDYDLFFQLLRLTTFVHLPEYLVFIRQHDGRSSSANRLAVARDHAANLVKYGFSPEYAYLRARRNPEWVPAIEEGIRIGARLRAALPTGGDFLSEASV